MKRIIIFASGAGSNTRQIINHFKISPTATVCLICCNKPGAGVLGIAADEQIPTLMLEKERFFNGDAYIPEINSYQPDLIVLAGFLWKLPAALVEAFPQKIINIHPALLPAFGGKGMYGKRVHEAVLASGSTTSGISIHYVDEHFDHGDLIFQARCAVDPGDTPETLARKIHALEHEHFPVVIENLLKV